ncbi:DUF1580 domain-containing protein [Blastopirellula sp. JC732]|uniref:DUF1580 domain-containing protein n=1 Tax=Blastopirellula sediminis TaxID=2894196 RepID=A0A9X1SGS2_9BACT|nr:DUF1580 domain-containing protein [Blastopirellula sediminis]MCC9606212.1 DUF1580 domain-containing protein [Blastopirellula sediminis]MCC9630490.1 DUF1580 domain-containing protein [Blastopirellula sediminis]
MTDPNLNDDLLAHGDLRPVAAIAQQITGKRPSGPTTWRWIKKGVDRGIKLLAVPCNGRWNTTEAAFRDFLARRADSLRQSATPTPEVDDETLRVAGLL